MTFVDPFAPYDSPHHPVNAGKQVSPEPELGDVEMQRLLELWPFVLNLFGTEEEQGGEFNPWLAEELFDRRSEYRDLLAEFGTEGERAETTLADDEEGEDEYGDNAPTLRALLARRDARQAETIVAPQDGQVDEEALKRPAASAPKPAWKAHLRALDPSVSDEDVEAMTVDVIKARTRELAAARS